MKRLLALTLLACAASAGAQTATQTPTAPAPTSPAPTVTFKAWTETVPLIDRQSKWILRHISELDALRADVAALKADRDALKAEVAALKTRTNVVENSYNIALYYALGHLCYTNTMLSSWSASLVGMKPFQLGTLPCPPEGERIYIPSFIGGIGAVLKPPQQ